LSSLTETADGLPVTASTELGEFSSVGDIVDASETTGSELFANDRGTLGVETRRALVQLLQGPSVDGRRQPKLWLVVRRDEPILRQHLHNLFLELVVDYDQTVAFTRQVVAESIEAPILLRRSSLTFLESALVIFIRQRLTQADAHGERAVLSKPEMFEHLTVYERDRNVDHARFERQMENAVEKAKKLNLLHKIRGGEERYEVSPTLKLLFPAEDIEALAQTYRSIAATALGQPGLEEGLDALEPVKEDAADAEVKDEE
jgi:Domain of unknown function (DUF4194)